jgi:hypothetical protein
MKRTVVTLAWIVLVIPAAMLWLILGCISMRRLGRAFEQTGINLQEYDW